MSKPRETATTLAGIMVAVVATLAFGQEPHKHDNGKAPKGSQPGRAPEELPKIPRPDANAAHVPSGYRVEVVFANLAYPSSFEFDDRGAMYIAEAGYIYGDDVAPARILRVPPKGEVEIVADGLNSPITDLLWHDGRLYISHRGKVSVLESGSVRDIVTGLPSLGDHHNNQLAAGPDGKLYFGQGVATNSGVVGLDNFKMGWLAKYAEVHDLPPKDIRVTDQAFETPDPLTMLSDKRKDHEGHAGKGHHDGKGQAAKGEVKKEEHAGHEHGANEPNKQKSHEGHKAEEKASGKAKAHEGHKAEQHDTDKGERHEGHEDNEKPHDGHKVAKKVSEKAKGHEGHGDNNGAQKKHQGHGSGENVQAGHAMVKTYAFQPFGKTPPDNGAVRGNIKANGTILRMNPDGSDLEVYAWGLRNPYGLAWSADGKLYASDNGYDERGSRPIAHAPDCLWEIKQEAWYGFPDYAGGIPVTDARFLPEHGPPPKFLMRDHPPVEKPALTLKHHVAAAQMDFSRNDVFGFKGQLFLALAGDMNPITGEHEERSGFEVVRIDPATSEVETFFKAKHDALGTKGMEFVATAGPKRPVDVRFSKRGDSLYVVDVGAMAIVSTATGPAPRPFPRTGVIWRIAREGSSNH